MQSKATRRHNGYLSDDKICKVIMLYCNNVKAKIECSYRIYYQKELQEDINTLKKEFVDGVLYLSKQLDIIHSKKTYNNK